MRRFFRLLLAILLLPIVIGEAIFRAVTGKDGERREGAPEPTLKGLYGIVTERAEPNDVKLFSIEKPGLLSCTAAELMFEQPPHVGVERLIELLQGEGRRVTSEAGVVRVEFSRYQVEMMGTGRRGAWVLVEPTPFRFEGEHALELDPTTAQSHSEVARSARGWPWGVRCFEHSPGLPAKYRMEVLCEVLLLLTRALTPRGLYWRSSTRVLAADQLEEVLSGSDPVQAFHSSIVLRQVRVNNGGAGDLLFDTRGLQALSLPEVQLHFRDMDVPKASALVVAVSSMLFDQGLFASDGDLLKEIPGAADVRVRYELSLRDEKTVVLDLDPGRARSAGIRPS